MLRFLFPRLTAKPVRGAELFGWVTIQARAPHWYLEGGVADSVDGRFAMLATIAALLTVRIERAGDRGTQASVALTERFIEVMESEHREMGLGDPNLGRTVRKLVGSLARRVELWRSIVSNGEWTDGARQSVFMSAEPESEALDHVERELRALWSRLDTASDAAVVEGKLE